MQVIEWEVKTMCQEEEFQKTSNTSSGGSGGGGCRNLGRSSSKKQKPKKVPQRGLGVAQLEKIRLEEQKKDGRGCSTILPRPLTPPPPPPPMLPPIKPETRTLNAVSAPNYQSFNSSVPYHSIGLGSSLNLLTKPQNGETVNPNSTVQLCWQTNAHKTRNQEDYRVDHGLVSGSHFDLSYGLHDPLLPLPSLIQRAQQHHHNLCSTVANVSTASSCLSSSSVLNFQLEPPSNQSFRGKCLPVWPADEKMVGMKRPYTFSLDRQPGQSSHCKIPCVDYPINSRSDESASLGNEIAFNFNPGIKVLREGVSRSNSTLMLNPKKRIQENRSFSGDFLTLAPPTPTKAGSNSKLRGPSPFIPFHEYQKFNFGSQNYEVEDQIPGAGPNLRNHHHQEQPFYSFLPQTNLQIDHHRINGFRNSCNGSEIGDNVIDLNLKL